MSSIRSETVRDYSASDIAITSDGRFIYTGLRGRRHSFDHIAGYSVQEDGTVKFLGLTKADATPWGLTLSPDGRHLLVSAADGKTLTAYGIAKDGSLAVAAKFNWASRVADLEAIPSR